MPISDELEALRQSSRVKTQSTRLSTIVASSSTALYTPQQQEELRKAKLTKEKQSKLEAERAWRSGASYTKNAKGLHDLLGNGLYGRLMNEHRRKVREAQKQLHEWKGSHQGKKKVGGKDEDGAVDGENIESEETNEQLNEEGGEEEIINNAVEMLPDHVVEALKEKYQTDSIVEALTKALQEEESGELSKVVMMSPVSKKEGEESSSVGSTNVESLPVPEEEKEEQEVVEQQQLQEDAEEETPQNLEEEEQQQVDTEEATEVPQEEKPIEEVREKIEHLSINDVSFEEPADSFAMGSDEEVEEQTDETEAVDDAAVEEPTEPVEKIAKAEVEEEEPRIIATPDKKSSSTKASILDSAKKTKSFYNKHADELIAKINKDADALTPTALRNSFLNYLQEVAQPVTKDADICTSTIIDLGCGHGRDTLHFTTLGHHVLAVDYSYAMLHHAKTIAPHAHYLNMDMRLLKNLLIDQSVDGIWSHGSLSHLPKDDLESLLKGLYVSIKVGGVLYFSVKVGTHDQIGQAGEVVEPDTRYTPIDSEEDICKLYSYYTSSEVVELLSKTGWEVIKIGEYDQRDKSDYPTHSLLYVFATRRKD